MGFQLLGSILCIIHLIFDVSVFAIGKENRTTRVLDAIPTVGSSSWLGSWWAGLTFLKNAPDVVQEGYDKFKSAPFKVAEAFRWRVIVSSRSHLEELTAAPNDEFSSWKALEGQIQMNHTLGRDSDRIPRYLPFVGACVSGNIDAMSPEIGDEIVASFSKVLVLTENEWKCVPALNIIKEVVCRTSNRVFVGFPLCRNPDWIELSQRCTDDLVNGGIIVGMFPKIIRFLIVRHFTTVPRTIARCTRLLEPIVKERQKYLHKCKEEWDDRPNDLLLWLMEDARNSDELTAECLIIPLLLANVAALHTVSNSFTQALFCLAANPQYIRPLRDEVEDVVGKYGWSKIAQGKMRRVDSFFRECQRIHGINTVTLARTALKDFTFSDGTFIPKGTSIAAACRPIHHDEKFYDSPDAFNPFRFVNMDEDNGEWDAPNHRFVTTSLAYLPFGHGRQACPGRFLAACQMKLMLAHIIMTYDVKLEGDATVPPDLHFGVLSGANSRAKVMFRNRVD